LHESEIDRIDHKILGHLQRSGRASNLELAAAAGLSAAQCHLLCPSQSRGYERLMSLGLFGRS
jgi:6-phosphofructokinase